MGELRGLVCAGLPVRFPTQPVNGRSCIFTLHGYGSSATLARPAKSRKPEGLLAGHKACCKHLAGAGIKPTYQRLGSEAPDALLGAAKENGLGYQLVAPHGHRWSLAERAARALKEHFAAILNGTGKGIPAGL